MSKKRLILLSTATFSLLSAGAAMAALAIGDGTTSTRDPATGKLIVANHPAAPDEVPSNNWTFGTSTTEPLTLFYRVRDIGGGLFDYSFTLKLTNLDGSWAPGQGWRWLIFGDQESMPSNLLNFIGDTGDLPIGPWTSYGSSGGYHNGPTLSYVLDYWVPTAVGEQLKWSGTSTVDLPAGELLWSTIAGTQGGAIPANFTPACRREGTPCNPCDTNCDGVVDALDIEPLICLLFDPNCPPCSPCAGDTNGDGVVDALDIEPFIECLFGP